MRSRRQFAEAAIGLLLAGLILVVGGAAVWLRSATSVRDDPATLPSTASAAPSDRYAGPVEESRRLARALIVDARLNDLSVAVAVDSEIVWAEGFGWTDADRLTHVTPLTRYRLGALSKPLTAMAVAFLHDRGRLDLDAPIQRYVPAYPEKQWEVTTRQLMGDVAGVHRMRGDNNDAMPVRRCGSVDEAVAMLADDPLLFEPGTQYRYSIWGWVLVSAVVEGAAREPFERFMDREVFEPLGMERTLVAEAAGRDRVPRMVFGIRAGVEDDSRPDYSCLAGGGAFVSTPTDLVRLGSAMLKPGRLKAETIDAFRTPTRLASGTPTTYALGWTVGTVQLAGQSVRMVSHRGSPRGGTVSLLTFPDLGLAIATAVHAQDVTGVRPFALQVAEAFSNHQDRGTTPPPRPDATAPAPK